jgi:gamma-glutamyltranspeptidase
MALKRAGFRLTPLEPYSFKTGGLQLLVRDGSRIVGVSEPRRDGAAAGPRDQS